MIRVAEVNRFEFNLTFNSWRGILQAQQTVESEV
jgi:hypothetical protein